MAEPPRYSEPDMESDRQSTTGTPRWQKVVAIIGLVVLVVVVLMLTGVFGSGHVPGPPAGGH